MSAPRRFDHDDAVRRYEAGARITDLAAEYGVSWNAVKRVVDPEVCARMAASATRFNMSAVCVECGGACARYRTGIGVRPQPRCQSCWARSLVTSVQPDRLRCVTCHEWKRDEAFPHHRGLDYRRRRHTICRSCHTKVKRAYREAHRQPCSHGCGRLVDTVDRRDKTKPLECRSCARKRIIASRKVAA